MTRVKLRVLGLVGVAMVLSCSPGQPPARPAGGAAPVAVTAVAPTRVFPGSVATALDEARGVPRFLWATTRQPAATGATAEAAARAHLARHAAAYRVAPAQLASAELMAVHDTGRGGIIATLRQRAHGIEVYRGEVKVLMRRNLDLVAITGTPRPTPATPPVFARSPEDALADALGAHYGAAVAAADVAPLGPAPGGYQRLDLVRPVGVAGATVRLARPARVKPVLFPRGATLVPAYFVEFFAAPAGRGRGDAFRYLVAAADGRVLERRNLTADAHQYRVWADADGRPTDGPQADFTPHPTGTPDGSDPAFVPPSLIAREAFNTNPAGQSDPWLAPGATDTRGNNVDAYADLQAPDGYSSGDVRPTTTAPDTFDRVYDTALAPSSSQNQIMASMTNLFYITNWLHDWYYDSGFDEAAGNAQADNFGRGGLGNDRLLAEGQDYSGTDNSNMSTPTDGDSPVMQMFLWSGPETRTLHVTPLDVDLDTSPAEFGLQSYDVTGTIRLVADGTAPASDACQTITNNVSGTIALLDRGTCTFKQKAVYAQAAGAIGVILVNNQGGGAPYMPDGTPQGTVTIPVLSVSQADGATLKAALQSGTVSAHLARIPGVMRDASLDTTIVAHEWGHYLHLRLADCGQQLCAAMSEGWGDFNALQVVLREGDDLDGTYAMAIYSAKAMGDSGYFGIRRAPYSVDFTKNPFTFRHIADAEPLPTTAPLQDLGVNNAEVHAAGEIWAEMLFEADVALLKQTQGPGATRTFDEARRAMSDYVVAGLKLTPPDATYTEGRDAILAAAAAADLDDEATIAAAFARRGAGSCAVSPPRDSIDNAGVVESFEVKPRVAIGTPTLDDSLLSCDDNGRLDGGERGRLQVAVANDSTVALDGATLTVTAADGTITFPAGATVTIGALAPFASTTASVEVALDPSVATMTLVKLDVKVAAAAACETEVTRSAAFRANYTEVTAASATDDVESATTTWTPTGDGADVVWSRVEPAPGNHVWRGIDLARPSDSWLESPPLSVSASGHFVVSFRHRHEFETDASGSSPIYYDGAVIELSRDGGTTWEDVSTYTDPGYGGTIDNTAGNPLADRLGYVDHNAAWPDMEAVSLDLGTGLAGETVILRFHIGTDQAAGGAGWDLDDITFQGIDNTPFTALVDSPSTCAAPTQADAGTPTSDGALAPDGGSPTGDNKVATCGGCTAGRRPDGAALLGALAAAVVLGARRRRR